MNEDELTYVSNVADRFNNYIYPELRNHIENYLTPNYDKVKYYAHYNLSVDYLIKEIIKHEDLLNGTKYICTSSIMEIIAPMIEKEVFIRGI